MSDNSVDKDESIDLKQEDFRLEFLEKLKLEDPEQIDSIFEFA